MVLLLVESTTKAEYGEETVALLPFIAMDFHSLRMAGTTALFRYPQWGDPQFVVDQNWIESRWKVD